MCYCRTRLRIAPELLAPTYTFGAPPVLAVDLTKPKEYQQALPAPSEDDSGATTTSYNSGSTDYPGFSASYTTDVLRVLDLSSDHVRHFVQGLDVVRGF